MTDKPMISIDGALREMNSDELAQFELDLAESKKIKDSENAKLAAKESALAKLAALGLTEEEIAAL
jgi:DNA-binding NarL/FixJ family response regulator